ncbi:hypothetical protein [Deinococcus sp. NW-56]|uniref:hypothetical protein n=1 Tax=Deinococcus sp. NW-56 TaxID=2080419 RepID=UPI00131A2726|nr:hypothetical protein [Deinococcus sp. NW-56]
MTGVQSSTANTLDRKVPPGGKILVVTLTYRNPHFRPFKIGNAFPPVRLKVFDQDGAWPGARSGNCISRPATSNSTANWG